MARRPEPKQDRQVATTRLVAVTGGSEPLFVVLVVVHVVSALAGFGSIGFAGTYASRAAHLPGDVSLDDAEVEELTRYFDRPARFWKAVLVVPVFGVLALLADPHGKGLDQLWVVGALLVWVAASVLAAGVVAPALHQVRSLLAEAAGAYRAASSPSTASAGPGVPGPSTAGGPGERVPKAGPVLPWQGGLNRAGSRASRAAAACDVLFFVALAFMVWRP